MDDLPNLQELKKEESIFDSLQKNALETIRELSGQLWTDHAPHDPGITTLDILNYALSELDYQMSFPLEQYSPDRIIVSIRRITACSVLNGFPGWPL